MTGMIDARLAELGVSLPDPPAPAANYVPFVIVGDMVYVSGQVAMGPDGPIIGRLGKNMDVEGGQAAARACAISLIAQLRKACGGDLDRVRQVVKLTAFVKAIPNYTKQPEVVNGASDLLAAVFGDKGAHARSAVGVASLPFGVAVEIEGIFQIA